jgi:hypothetical protein
MEFVAHHALFLFCCSAAPPFLCISNAKRACALAKTWYEIQALCAFECLCTDSTNAATFSGGVYWLMP